MSKLNLNALMAAIEKFEEGVNEANANTKNELMRDGVIQRFEYTMDLSWKMMQRYLKTVVQVDEANFRTKNDIFREAAKAGLIDDAEVWIGHYAARNETSHDYNIKKAQMVYDRAKLFLPDVKMLLAKFIEMN